MLNPILLTSINFAGGAPAQGLVNIAPKSPSGKLIYVKHLLFRLVHSIAGASTSDAITVLQCATIITQIAVRDRNGGYIGSRGPIPGTFLRKLRQIVLNESLTKGDATATNANANGTNVKESLFVMPFEIPGARNPGHTCPLLSTIQQVDVTWGSGALAGLLGTGNTVNASGATYLEVYAVPEYRETLDTYPRIIYHRQSPSKFLGEVVDLNCKVLALGLGDFTGAAATTMGSTDFTSYGIQGNDGLNVPRQHINAGSYAQSMIGSPALAAYALPNSGSAEVIPFVTPGVNFDMEALPYERAVSLDVVIGAGTPSVADQDIYFVGIEPEDAASWSANVGKSPNVDVSQDNARRAIVATAAMAPARSAAMGLILKGHPMERFVKRPVPTKIAAGRA
jgi:hypothetical protein